MTPVDVVIISGCFTLVGSLLAWWLARRNRKDDDKRPGSPTVQQVWERQDKQERALDASLVLVGQLVKQHDDPHKLVLSQAAIRTLRETGFMPPELEDVLAENDKKR